MKKNYGVNYRLKRASRPSVRSWQKPAQAVTKDMQANVSIEMGWGSLIFGQTFDTNENLANAIQAEQDNHRDIAFYIRDPHVVLAIAPDELFLDPSHAYRIWSYDYRPGERQPQGFSIRRMCTPEEAQSINRLYASRNMVQCDPEFMLDRHATRLRTYFIAETQDKQIVGTVTGIDHVRAFNDPENGASLWCLAVDPQANIPGVGEALVRRLLEHYFTKGREYVDLSVMHYNKEAIALYEKLGFQRVPVFCIKRKNIINEQLYTQSLPDEDLNPYAMIIINEARRRGIGVEVLDAEYGYFRLQMGGRAIICRESLTELTSAIAMSRCDDKRITHRVLNEEKIKIPRQYINQKPPNINDDSRWVVKPARGEQGKGISVDVRSDEELDKAIEIACKECQDYIVESYEKGRDLRIIVIDFNVVAAAIRKPPKIIATGQHTIKELIQKYNRRREAATGGESRVPIDSETIRCLSLEGYDLDSIPDNEVVVNVRKTANLHTGGTIHDVTDQLHPELRKVAEKAARALDIPVVGLDFMVPDVSKPDYVVIEANERPGLANHEPQPTAQRFIDLLFPQTAAVS